MSWYTPMPIKNGSVVMRVDVSSNGLGPFIHDKRCLFPSLGWVVDSGRAFLISRSPEKPGGDPREGSRLGGVEAVTLTCACPHLLPGFR